MAGFAEHADRQAAEHPLRHLAVDASPAERGDALEQVLLLADALRRPGPAGTPEARSVHEAARYTNRHWRLRSWRRRRP
ncbi:MAG: hypothetical protein M0008_08875 [Actinomycetota bacterium]|jgi:hypothetical protein|nr:hypothetical protein [Actinomycetota bacterium]